MSCPSTQLFGKELPTTTGANACTGFWEHLAHRIGCARRWRIRINPPKSAEAADDIHSVDGFEIYLVIPNIAETNPWIERTGALSLVAAGG